LIISRGYIFNALIAPRLLLFLFLGELVRVHVAGEGRLRALGRTRVNCLAIFWPVLASTCAQWRTASWFTEIASNSLLAYT